MIEICNDLYQFTENDPTMGLYTHQYLLLTEDPVLIHTGTMKQAETILPKIKTLLGGRELRYILVSHFETEVCGGLLLFQIAFPEAITICSEAQAWQLYNLGYTSPVAAKKTGETLTGDDFEFYFYDYPSGAHKMEGLLFIENKRGIFFSGDLMSPQASQENLIKLKDELLKQDPAVIAVGQSPFPDLKK